MQEYKEAFEAVEKINEELDKKYEGNTLLSISYCGMMFSISLDINSNNIHIELEIYNSEQDDRIYYEKSDKYETFYKYIKRKVRNIKEEIYSVKL